MNTTHRVRHLVGVGIVALGAIGFAFKAILVKLLYQYQVDATSMLALRFWFSLPFFLAVIVWHWPRAKFTDFSPRDRLLLVFLAFVGYYGSALLDFWGLRFVSAALERLILFIYPTVVLLIMAGRFGQRITRRQVLALGLTYAGIAVALAGEASFTAHNLWLGAGLIFASAVAYAIYFVGSGRLIPRIGSSLLYTSYIMLFSTGFITLHFLAVHPVKVLANFSREVYQLYFWMALLATVLPAFLTAEGIRRIGAGNASIVGTIGPVSTLVMAHYFLEDEKIGMAQVLGTLLVVAGVLVIGAKAKPKVAP
ncbi:MAG: DMT family transporter [Bernardetiaceae bacterium]|nr:DMT family transporter [Bernardetiaceae bacterium]